MQILLDTHIFIWFLEDSRKLKPLYKVYIEDVNNKIFISQFSLIEIAIKLKLGKLFSNETLMEDIFRELDKLGINIIPIKNKHIEAYQSIPLLNEHKDPFDRFIIATAFSESLQVITDDEKFSLYSDKIHLL